MAKDHADEWYYCLTHKTVEPYEGCKSADRLGPYPTQQDAQQALERAEERNEAYDTDPRFNDPDEGEDGDDDDDKESTGWGSMFGA